MKVYLLSKLLFCIAFLLPAYGFAQVGSLDPGFGSGGIVTTDFHNYIDVLRDIAIQSDGKIVAAGLSYTVSTKSDFALARYKTDGSLDKTFGTGGKATIDFDEKDYATAMRIQPDGKILVTGFTITGTNNFILARFNADGSPDAGFGNGGKVRTDLPGSYEKSYSVEVQSTGKVIQAGWVTMGSLNDDMDFALVRYKTDGSMDTSFGDGGKRIVNLAKGSDDYPMTVLVLENDALLAIGYSVISTSTWSDGYISMARFDAEGNLDTSFGIAGIVQTKLGGMSAAGLSAALQPDGKILVGGNTNVSPSHFIIARFTEDGRLDSTFNAKGYTVSSPDNAEGNALAIGNDGKIVIAGQVVEIVNSNLNYNIGFVRYDRNGSLDTSLNKGGSVIIDNGGDDFGSAVAIQADGKIIVAGTSGKDAAGRNFFLARYTGCRPVKFSHYESFHKPGASYTVGKHTYTKSGTYVDTLRTVSGCDSIVTSHLTFFAGIKNDQRKAAGEINVYPNPFSGSTTIDIRNPAFRNGHLVIFDVAGREVHSQMLRTNKEILNLNLQPGVYYFEVSNDLGGTGTGKLIVQ